ncbi:hypothetical protein PS15p_206100 [Mucor circinelloides]
MQVEKLSWDNSIYSGFNVDSNNNHSNGNHSNSNHSSHLNIGRAVIKEYKSSHVLIPFSSKEPSQRLNALTHCQKCSELFKQPTTLSCGFTSCYDCLPSTEPYQCISFSCLRKHDNDYRPTILLENIMSNLQDIDIIKQLLDCSICLSPLTDPITTQCGHTFCKECLIRTMTDLKTRSCPFCRHELSRIGKINQIVCGWVDYIYHDVSSTNYPLSTLDSQQHIPVIQVSSTVAFPSQHCLIHVTDDKNSLLQEMTTRPHQKHFAICVFAKDGNSNDLYDYGIMLQVNHVEHSPDIRHSVVQAVGLFRLKINNFSIDQEGRYIGSVTRFDDCNTNDVDNNAADGNSCGGDDYFDLDFDTQSKRWTMPTLNNTATTRSTVSRPIATSSSTVTANNNIKTTRPRPCSMRLSSSAPNNIPTFNNIPGLVNRRTWASTMNFGGLKPPSPPPLLPTTINTSQFYFKSVKKAPVPVTSAIPNINLLFNQEIHPRLVQYLSATANHIWIMQYDWYLQQSDRESLIWWIANVLPFNQEEKMHLLSISTLRGRIMIIHQWFDRLQPQQLQL